jgi:hypothetical protein
MQLLDILGSSDEDINSLSYMAFWCAPQLAPPHFRRASLASGFACS